MLGTDVWGGFTYGGSGTDVPDRVSPNDEADFGEITPVEAFGSGIALNPSNAEGYNWDFRVDPTGDLMATRGWDELYKDIAFYTARELKAIEDRPITANRLEAAKIAVEAACDADPRLETVERVVAERGPEEDTIDISISVIGNDGKRYEHVFPVSR
jgi:hypothetical protein